MIRTRIFENNLRRCGVENLLCGPARIVETAVHAARQLARPIEELGIRVGDLTEKVFPSADDRQFANGISPEFTATDSRHSSGKRQHRKEVAAGKLDRAAFKKRRCSTRRKQRWTSWKTFLPGRHFRRGRQNADESIGRREWKNRGVRFARNLPLTHLAAVLEHSIFIGHDSGISHLAAAAGANCVLLFGPTDPDVWAPRNKNVQVLRAQSGRLGNLGIAAGRRQLSLPPYLLFEAPEARQILAPGTEPGIRVSLLISRERGDRIPQVAAALLSPPTGLASFNIENPGLTPGATFFRAYGAPCGLRYY